MTGVSPN